MLVHRPFAERVGHVRDVEDAALVLRHETIVRDDVGEQVAGVAHRDGALFVPAGRGEPPQRRPLVRAAEGAEPERAPGERQVRQAGAGKDQARQALRGGADLRIGEGRRREQPLREEHVGLQPPGKRVRREQHAGHSI